MTRKICPCGERLVQRDTETDKQFEARQYCNAQHAGKYRPRKPAGGSKVRRLGKGYKAYLEGVRPMGEL